MLSTMTFKHLRFPISPCRDRHRIVYFTSWHCQTCWYSLAVIHSRFMDFALASVHVWGVEAHMLQFKPGEVEYTPQTGGIHHSWGYTARSPRRAGGVYFPEW